jgi:hypothetical protein
MHSEPVDPGPHDRDAAARSADPATDTPAEALIRHGIAVAGSHRVRFGHNLMLVLMIGFGIGFVVMGVVVLSSGAGPLFGLLPMVLGVFLAAWAPIARRMIAGDTARKIAAMEHQLHQARTARFTDNAGL